MLGVQRAGIGVGKALGALTIAGGIVNAIDGDGSGHIKLQQLQQDLLNGGEAISAWDRAVAGMEQNTFWTMGKNIDDLGSALRAAFGKDTGAQIGHGIDKVLNTVTLGTAGLESVVDKGNKAIADMDSMLAELVSSGHADLAAKQLDQVAEYAKTLGVTSEQLAAKLPQYGEALAAVGNQTRLAGDNAAGASVSLAYPFGSPLAIVRHGVRTFVDWGTVYDAGTKVGDATFDRGIGVGWFANLMAVNAYVDAGRANGAWRVHVRFGTGF